MANRDPSWLTVSCHGRAFLRAGAGPIDFGIGLEKTLLQLALRSAMRRMTWNVRMAPLLLNTQVVRDVIDQ